MAILTTDYNALQARILKILGEGTGEYGYGQPVTSTPMSIDGALALKADFEKLRADILAARYHQIGVPSTPLIPIVPSLFTNAMWTQFLTVMTSAETSKLVTPPATQATRSQVTEETTQDTTWNNTITHIVTAQFNDLSHMRHYFNTGSTIEFSASQINSASNAKSVAWTSLLSSIGTVSFKYDATTSSKTAGTTIGFKSLTSTSKVIFKKTKADTPSASIYQISAVVDKSTFTITFTIECINTGANVTGNLSSVVNVYYATGSYVEVEPPVIISDFTPGLSKPTFALSRSITTINETNITVEFTVNTTNFQGSLLYFNITGTSISVSDFDPLSDLTPGKLTGAVELTAGSGSFVIIAAADTFTEGKEQFNVQIRLDDIANNPKGEVVAQLSSLEIINDTSISLPAPSFSFLPLSTTSVTEGQSIRYRIVTKNVKDGTDITWTTKILTPSLLPSDFVDNRLEGVVTVYGNSTDIYRTIYEDTLKETTAESYQIVLSILNETTGIPRTVQTSEIVKITDKITIEPTIPYVVLTDDILIQEDSVSAVTFTIKTPKLPINTKLYWKTFANVGKFDSKDFTDGALTGSVLIRNNVGTVVRKAKKDIIAEGNEAFRLSFFTDAGMTEWVVDSDVITIEESVSYVLTRTPATMEESTTNGAVGVGVNFSLTTPWLTDGTILYWTTVSEQGVIESTDFTDNAIDGTVTINGNAGTILRRAASDNLIEGVEQFHLEIRATSGNTGPILATSQTTSITETVSYKIVPSNASMDEASLVNGVVVEKPGIDFTIYTPFLKNGTILYWDTVTDSGSITASDFTDNRMSGTVEINSNMGVITRTAARDTVTEGKESFHLILKTGTAIGTKVATSSVVYMGENVEYTITPTLGEFTEGRSGITINFTTDSVDDNTKVFWTTLVHSGNITGDDFIVSDAQGGGAQRLSGYALTSKNKGSFIISGRPDNITEGNETFQIELRIGSIAGTVQKTSSLITLREVVPYTIQPSALSINEGDSIQFSITTPWIDNLEKRQLNWTTQVNSGTINITDHPDFTSVTSGSVTVYNNGAEILRTAALDNFTEMGVDAFSIKLWDTSGTLLATSAVVTINDTSQTIEVPLPNQPTYSILPEHASITEGDTVRFNITTTDLLPSTPLYWTLYKGPGLLDGDIFQTASIAPIYITYNNPGTPDTTGSAHVDIVTIKNTNSQKDRGFIFELRTGSNKGTVVATSDIPVMIADEVPYVIKAFPLSIEEGSLTGVRFDISTPAASFGTTMTWTIVPDLNSDITYEDFTGLSNLTGTVDIDSTGLGYFTLNAASHSAKEGNESFHIELTPAGTSTRLGSKSPTVKITEVQSYTLITTTPTVQEGTAASFTFSTPKLSVDTQFTYSIYGTVGTIDGTDFNPATLTGTITVPSSTSTKDFTILTTVGGIENNEKFKLEFKLTSTNQLVNLFGGSPEITITENKTSQWEVKPRVSKVYEGDSVTFDITTEYLGIGTKVYCLISPALPGTIASTDITFLNSNTLTPYVELDTDYSGSLTLTIANDGVKKGDRNFTLKANHPTSGAFYYSTPVTIQDPITPVTPVTTGVTPGVTPVWRLVLASSTVLKGSPLQYTLTTTVSTSADRAFSWNVIVMEQLDKTKNSNPFSNITGTFTFPANQTTLSFSVPTINDNVVGIGVMVRLVIKYLNEPVLYYGQGSDIINSNGGPYSSGFSGYATTGYVVDKKSLSISITKNKLMWTPQRDEFTVDITAPWYYDGMTVLIQVPYNNFWHAKNTNGAGFADDGLVFGPHEQYVPVTVNKIGLPVNPIGTAATGSCKIFLNNLTGISFAPSIPTFLVKPLKQTNTAGVLLDCDVGSNQSFTINLPDEYTLSVNNPLITDVAPNNVAQFTVVTPAGSTITTLYFTIKGVDPKELGLTSATVSKAKDSSNITHYDFTAELDTISTAVKSFYVEVRSVASTTAPVLSFTNDYKAVKVNITPTGPTKATISFTSYKNDALPPVATTEILMMESTASTPAAVNGWLIATISAQNQIAGDTYTIKIQSTNVYIAESLVDRSNKKIDGSTIPYMTNGTAVVTMKATYNAKITTNDEFRIIITSVKNTSIDAATGTLTFRVPDKPPTPVMSISPSSITTTTKSTLKIEGAKSGQILTIKKTGPAISGAHELSAPTGKTYTVTSTGIVSIDIMSWVTTGTATFTATFLDKTPINSVDLIISATLPVTTLTVPTSPVIFSTTILKSKIVSCSMYPATVSKSVTVTVTSTEIDVISSISLSSSTIATAKTSTDSTWEAGVTVTALAGTKSGNFTITFTSTAPVTNAPLTATYTGKFEATYTPVLTINPTPVDYSTTAVLSISGAKPGTASIKAIGVKTVAGTDYNAKITIPTNGNYTCDVGPWKTGGTAKFVASFVDNKTASFDLVVTPPAAAPIIITVSDRPTKVTVGDIGSVITFKITPHTAKLTVAITINGSAGILQSLGATSNGVLNNTDTTVDTGSTWIAKMPLTAASVAGLSNGTFTVTGTTKNPNTGETLTVTSAAIEFIVPAAALTPTVSIVPPARAYQNNSGTKLSSILTIAGGNPASNITVAISLATGGITAKTNWKTATLNQNGGTTLEYNEELPGPGTGTFVVTFDDNTTKSATLTISDAYKSVTKTYTESQTVVLKSTTTITSIVCLGAQGGKGGNDDNNGHAGYKGSRAASSSTAQYIAGKYVIGVGGQGTAGVTQTGPTLSNLNKIGGWGGENTGGFCNGGIGGTAGPTGVSGAGGGGGAGSFVSKDGTMLVIAGGGAGGGGGGKNSGGQGTGRSNGKRNLTNGGPGENHGAGLVLNTSTVKTTTKTYTPTSSTNVAWGSVMNNYGIMDTPEANAIIAYFYNVPITPSTLTDYVLNVAGDNAAYIVIDGKSYDASNTYTRNNGTSTITIKLGPSWNRIIVASATNSGTYDVTTNPYGIGASLSLNGAVVWHTRMPATIVYTVGGSGNGSDSDGGGGGGGGGGLEGGGGGLIEAGDKGANSGDNGTSFGSVITEEYNPGDGKVEVTYNYIDYGNGDADIGTTTPLPIRKLINATGVSATSHTITGVFDVVATTAAEDNVLYTTYTMVDTIAGNILPARRYRFTYLSPDTESNVVHNFKVLTSSIGTLNEYAICTVTYTDNIEAEFIKEIKNGNVQGGMITPLVPATIAYTGTLVLNVIWSGMSGPSTPVAVTMTDNIVSYDMAAQRKYYYVYYPSSDSTYGKKTTSRKETVASKILYTPVNTEIQGFVELKYADGTTKTVPTVVSKGIPKAPSAPLNLEVIAEFLTHNTAWVRWNDPLGWDGKVEKYIISKSIPNSTNQIVVREQPATYTQVWVSAIVESLLPNTTYTVYVVSSNVTATDVSSVTFKTKPTPVSQVTTGDFIANSTRRGNTNIIDIAFIDTIASPTNVIAARRLEWSYINNSNEILNFEKITKDFNTAESVTIPTTAVLPAGITTNATFTIYFTDNTNKKIVRTIGISEIKTPPPPLPAKPINLVNVSKTSNTAVVKFQSGGTTVSVNGPVLVTVANFTATATNNNLVIEAVSCTAIEAKFVGLQPFTQYAIRVSANNITGSTISDPITVVTSLSDAQKTVTGTVSTVSNTRNGDSVTFVVKSTLAGTGISHIKCVYSYGSGGPVFSKEITLSVTPNVPNEKTGSGSIPYGVIGSAEFTVTLIDGSIITPPYTTQIGIVSIDSGFSNLTVAGSYGPQLLPAASPSMSRAIVGSFSASQIGFTLTISDTMVSNAGISISKRYWYIYYTSTTISKPEAHTKNITTITGTFALPVTAITNATAAYVEITFPDGYKVEYNVQAVYSSS